MHEPFEAKGFWYLPNIPTREVPGTLSFHPDDGFRLVLLGTLGDDDFFSAISSAFSESDNDDIYRLIYGVVDKNPYGTHFTLIDCFRLRASFDFSGSPRETIFVNRAFAGPAHVPSEDSSFTRAEVNYTYLQDWLGQSGVSFSMDSDDEKRVTGITIRCVPVPPREFSLENADIDLKVTWTGNESRFGGASVNESAVARVRLVNAATAEEILSDFIRPLQDLLTLGTNRLNFVTEVSLSGLTDDDPNHSYRLLYMPIGTSVETEKPEKRLLPPDMLFTLSDFDGSEGDVLRRWFEFHARRIDFCNRYFNSQYAPPRFIDQRFESVATALSLLLDDEADETSPKEAFDDEFRATFWMAASNQPSLAVLNKQWIDDVLPSRAEVLFPHRLRAVIDRYSKVLNPIAPFPADAFVDYVSRTLAYTRMRSRESRTSSLHGSELHAAIRHLGIVCKILVLEKLGANGEHVRKVLNRNLEYGSLRRKYAAVAKDDPDP